MNEPLTYDELLHRIWVVGHHTAELLVKYEDSTFLKYADISHQQYVILMIMAMQKEPTTATFISGRECILHSLLAFLDAALSFQ